MRWHMYEDCNIKHVCHSLTLSLVLLIGVELFSMVGNVSYTQ